MSPATLADLVQLLHFAFILFVLFGGLLALLRPWVAWIHVPMFFWGAVVNISAMRCPLTPLENHYRNLAGQAGYDAGFVQHYIAPLIYPEGLTQDLGLAVGIGTLLWNLTIYAFVLWHHHVKPKPVQNA